MVETKRVSLLVIGQAPRPALEREFQSRLGEGVEISAIGALDGMSRQEIAECPPKSGSDTLYTTLPDGSSTLLSKALVTERLVARLKDEKLDSGSVNILCCTGKFAALEEAGVLLASDIVTGAIMASVKPGARFGLFIPNEGQIGNAVGRWADQGIEAHVIALAPDSDGETIDRAAKKMAVFNPDLVLYDCMSYPTSLRQRAEKIYATKSLLAVSLAARLAAELLNV